MVKMLKYLFAVDKKPQRGLIAAEWAMMAYLVLTLLYMFFTQWLPTLQFALQTAV